MNDIDNVNQTAFLVISKILKQGKNIDITATLIAMMTILGYLCTVFNRFHLTGLGLLGLLSLLCWLIQKFYAIRVSIDAALFLYLAEHSQQASERIIELDYCLIKLKLKKHIGGDWLARQQGALALLKKQILFFIVQLILFFSILVWLIIL